MSVVHVFYPTGDNSRDFLFTDWARSSDPDKRPQVLRQVMTLDLPVSGTEAAELAFSISNSSPGAMHCAPQFEKEVVRWRRKHLRSMSVGDVVQADGSVWICAEVGFRVLDGFELAGLEIVIGEES